MTNIGAEGVLIPLPATMARYGLENRDYMLMLYEQGWACGVCKKQPASGRLFIDHEHVKGWKKMAAVDRRKYVRGLACYVCNRFILNHRVTPELLQGASKYLTRYEKRRDGLRG